MKRKQYFQLRAEQEKFKKRIWKVISIKKYPGHISTYDFLTIFLTKAKKAYREHVSYYCLINWQDISSAVDSLEIAKQNFDELFGHVASVQGWFRSQIQQYALGNKYDVFFETLEQFTKGISEERDRLSKRSRQGIFSDLIAA